MHSSNTAAADIHRFEERDSRRMIVWFAFAPEISKASLGCKFFQMVASGSVSSKASR
jgi:hypothetical protein